MNYLEARSKIKTGDTLAWSEGDWKTWHGAQLNIVRMATRSEFAHVGTAWITEGRTFVIEAVVPKVRIFPLSLLTPFYWLPNKVGQERKITWTPEATERLLSYVGGDYSKIEAIKAFFTRIKEDKNWECAEVVGRALSLVAPSISSINFTPAEIVRHLQTHYNLPLIYVGK